MALMPTGNEETWMIRVKDRGQVYKLDILELFKKAGFTKDAYGKELPPNRIKPTTTKEPKHEKEPKNEQTTKSVQ